MLNVLRCQLGDADCVEVRVTFCCTCWDVIHMMLSVLGLDVVDALCAEVSSI